jgi:hypothetical protein
MKKEQFVKLINELVSLKKDADALNKAFKKFEPDFSYISFNRYENLIVKSLEFAMNDTSEWVSYWLYECDCGKNPLKVTKDKKTVPMKTAEDLYNCIMNV